MLLVGGIRIPARIPPAAIALWAMATMGAEVSDVLEAPCTTLLGRMRALAGVGAHIYATAAAQGTGTSSG